MRFLLVAAALMTACVPPFEYDEEVCGMKVKWGPQERSTENLCFTAKVCEDEVGVESVYGAQIEFQRDIDASCDIKSAAGCYDPNTDVIYLSAREDVRATALCHELVHRHLDYKSGGADGGHRSPLWALVDNAMHRTLRSYLDERIAAQRD